MNALNPNHVEELAAALGTKPGLVEKDWYVVLRVEMSFHAPALQPISRPLQSLMAKAQKQPPEISSFPCVDPIETAADK